MAVTQAGLHTCNPFRLFVIYLNIVNASLNTEEDEVSRRKCHKITQTTHVCCLPMHSQREQWLTMPPFFHLPTTTGIVICSQGSQAMSTVRSVASSLQPNPYEHLNSLIFIWPNSPVMYHPKAIGKGLNCGMASFERIVLGERGEPNRISRIRWLLRSPFNPTIRGITRRRE